MDKNVLAIFEKKLNHLKQACEFNNYELTILDTKEEVKPLLERIIQPNQSCSVGGSVTLDECGVIDYLENRKDIIYLDRYHCDDREDVFRKVFTSDVYLTSTNALTIKGELVNVDGNGNRVAAMIYGPKQVLVVVGINKLVNTLEEAEKRIKSIAAPANCARLNKDNPCVKFGHCVNCQAESRICNITTTISRAAQKGRIHLIIVKENLGY